MSCCAVRAHVQHWQAACPGYTENGLDFAVFGQFSRPWHLPSANVAFTYEGALNAPFCKTLYTMVSSIQERIRHFGLKKLRRLFTRKRSRTTLARTTPPLAKQQPLPNELVEMILEYCCDDDDARSGNPCDQCSGNARVLTEAPVCVSPLPRGGGSTERPRTQWDNESPLAHGAARSKCTRRRRTLLARQSCFRVARQYCIGRVRYAHFRKFHRRSGQAVGTGCLLSK